ncbi:MAG TPA: cell envelope biogenesis protein OmpA, partial [Alphaproteobacteria bacterium]|nr:cell envelope biogenesis protein OmpA [Alphaproteobacteria bacterium]
MKKHLMTAAAIGLALSVPAWSAASADEGWYGSLSVGYGGPDDADVNLAGTADREIQGEANWREALAFGYAYNNGWRWEIEGSHRYNDTGAIGAFEDSTSDFQIWSAMFNAYYDFNRDGWIQPYLGAGAGYGQVSGSLAGWTTGSRPVPNTGAADPRFIVSRDSDNTFVWNLIAGVGWAMGDNWMFDT